MIAVYRRARSKFRALRRGFAGLLRMSAGGLKYPGRRVLFYASSPLYLAHFRPVIERLTSHNSVQVVVTGPESIIRYLKPAEQRLFLAREIAQRIRLSAAVFSSSVGTERFASEVVKVLLPHGIGGGKTVNGRSWRYAPERTVRDGRPIFDLVLEASAVEARRVEQAYPWLRGTVTGAGVPLLDGLAGADSTVADSVLIQSTYGPSSLLGRVGPRRFVAEAASIGEMLQRPVILSLHPNNWSGYAGAPILGPEITRLAPPGVQVLKPFTPLQAYWPHVQICITDHTNLCVVGVLMRVALFVVHVESDDLCLEPGSPVARVVQSANVIRESEAWAPQLRTGLSLPAPAEFEEIRRSLVDGLGNGTKQVADAISALLTVDGVVNTKFGRGETPGQRQRLTRES